MKQVLEDLAKKCLEQGKPFLKRGEYCFYKGDMSQFCPHQEIIGEYDPDKVNIYRCTYNGKSMS